MPNHPTAPVSRPRTGQPVRVTCLCGSPAVHILRESGDPVGLCAACAQCLNDYDYWLEQMKGEAA